MVLEKTLESPRRSNQSILKEINPGISLEEMMLKLKLQYFGHIMRPARLDEALARIKIVGRNVNNHRYAADVKKAEC